MFFGFDVAGRNDAPRHISVSGRVCVLRQGRIIRCFVPLVSCVDAQWLACDHELWLVGAFAAGKLDAFGAITNQDKAIRAVGRYN